MFIKDDIISLDKSKSSPHSLIPRLITENSVLLDVGCNAGFLGKILKQKNIICDGIDINKKALLVAKKYYRKVYERDFYKDKLNLKNNKYDFIVFSDILEHLPRPDLLLKEALKYLKPTGKIIVSLPNIARFEIRLKLLFGNFNYSPGILSSDHLRFFTKNSAHDLLEKSGYKIVNIIPTGLGDRLKILLTLLAFQFIFIAEKK